MSVRPISVVVLLGLILLAQPGWSQEPSQDLDSRLIQAAGNLFPTTGSVQPSYTVTSLRFIERYADGFEYHTYQVHNFSADPVGRFTRVVIHVDAVSRIDFGVRLEDGRLKSVAPLEPIRFGKQPFPEFSELLASFEGRPVRDFATGMSGFFEALDSLAPAAAGPPKPISRPKEKPSTPVFTVTQPELLPGDPMPRFEAQDLAGRPIDESMFQGTRTAVLVASLAQGMSRDMLDAMHAGLASYPDISFLLILTDNAATAEAHARYLRGSAGLLQDAALDPKGALRKAFKCRVIPYLQIFGSNGRLQSSSFWKGRQALGALLALDKEVGGR